MYDHGRPDALALLRCLIYSCACVIPLAQADRVIPFEVPASGSKTGTYGYTATAANGSTYQAYGKWDTQSRFVNPKTSPIGAGASGFGGARYGFRGTVSVGSTVFKQLLLLEGAYMAFDWIKSQYAEKQGETFIPETLEYQQNLQTTNYTCTSESCFFYPQNEESSHFPDALGALHRAVTVAQSSIPNYAYMTYSDLNCQVWGCSIRYYAYDQNGNLNTGGYLYSFKAGDGAVLAEPATWENRYPAGEPTIDPDPYYTAAILDQFAGQLPALRERVSQNVEFLASPFRFTRKAADGAILEDWEGVLEPMDYPVINPYKAAVPAELPRVEPTPQLKTKNLLNGEEITTTTDPVTQPTGDPAAKDKVDLSKLEAYTAGINAAANAINQKMPEFANQEIEYTSDDSEIPVNDDLTAEEATTAIARLFVPTVTNPNTLLDTFIPLANDFNMQPILSDSSDSCPAPITLATIGGQRVQMSFDSICEFLRLIKKMILPAIGFFMALSWIKRISAAGG